MLSVYVLFLHMYSTLLASANLLTPDGEQWESRLYFLLIQY